MQVYDIIILVVLCASTVWGARRGLARQLAGLASLFFGYTVACNFRAPVAQLIDIPEPWNVFAAMLGLFIATSLGVWIVFRFFHGAIEQAGLGNFDSQMGGLLGLAKGGLVAMALTMAAVVMAGDSHRVVVLGSFTGYNIGRLLKHADSVVPSEWQEFMEPYFATLNEYDHLQPTPVAEENADPFEVKSPSDDQFVEGRSRYDDDHFGHAIYGATDNVGSESERQQTQSQATLLEPVFNR